MTGWTPPDAPPVGWGERVRLVTASHEKGAHFMLVVDVPTGGNGASMLTVAWRDASGHAHELSLPREAVRRVKERAA